MPKKALLSVMVLVTGLGIALWASKLDGVPPPRPLFERTGLVLTRADGTNFPFKVEVARSKEEQAYGLMFVQRMPADEGMIFPFAAPKEVAFWMKNTLIPLDMIFVRPDGTIGRIAANTRPQDETPVFSQEPVSAVIEINGGLAKKYGLETGNKVDFPVPLRAQ